MDFILQNIKDFTRIYIDDKVIINRILENHMIYISRVFDQFVEYNITIKDSKCFFGYLSAIILNQGVNIYGSLITENCFAILSKIILSKNAQDLKCFLGITEYLKHYCKDYANVIKSL